jgi:predicted regulator of Ras-like GTPase activity (Roadblock/LC7/MglB family)
MTSINNIEELVRLLDERPEWSEALRTRVLTRDLLDLPATVGQRFTQVDDQFARMSAAIERLAVHTDARFTRVDEQFARMSAAIERLAERTDERFAAMTAAIERLAERTDERFAAMTAAIERLAERTDERFNGVDARFAQMSAAITRWSENADARGVLLDRRLSRLVDDHGVLKGLFARDYIVKNPSAVTASMGFRWVRNVPQEEIHDLAVVNDTSHLPRGEVHSFQRADLVIDALDSQGNPCYVAVEVSFTVDLRDTGRAVRNAEWLKEFTGRDAYAAVAGVYKEFEVDRGINKGDVSWFEIERRILTTE